MNHYIKIFLAFSLANYLFLFAYDNYYLVGLEDQYQIESRDTLRQYALDLKTQLTQHAKKQEIINQWSSQNNMPSKIIRFEEITETEIKIQLQEFDYVIDLFAEYGPVVWLQFSDTQVVEIGPLDPLYIESTSLQIQFILLHLIINALLASLFFILYRQKSKRIENSLNSLLQRKGISHRCLGVQDILRPISNRLLSLDQLIREIDATNYQSSIDQRDLMHAVAHELRSPIARFSFALELLEDTSRTKEEKKLIAEMHDSIDELESLIKEILSYSRLSYGQITLNLETVDLVNLTQTIIARLQSLYPQQSFQINYQQENIEILADRRFLERALVNLLRNAARFSKREVQINLSQQDLQTSIVIDDDGIGIPPGKRERIFEAFTRLDPSRSRDSGGVGLGLAIVKKIIDKHHGEISVTDSPLGGARFSLLLPNVQHGNSIDSTND